jgi:hypothetical protein
VVKEIRARGLRPVCKHCRQRVGRTATIELEHPPGEELQLSSTGWSCARRRGEIFEDTVVASAILDRLLHQATVIAINGDSYRSASPPRSRQHAAPRPHWGRLTGNTVANRSPRRRWTAIAEHGD